MNTNAPIKRSETLKPFSQEHHVENLVEYRPKPGDPYTFQTVNEAQCNHPHGSADIEHVGCIAQTKHIPGKFFSAEHVALFVQSCFFPEKPSYYHHKQQVGDDDKKVW